MTTLTGTPVVNTAHGNDSQALLVALVIGLVVWTALWITIAWMVIR